MINPEITGRDTAEKDSARQQEQESSNALHGGCDIRLRRITFQHSAAGTARATLALTLMVRRFRPGWSAELGGATKTCLRSFELSQRSRASPDENDRSG